MAGHSKKNETIGYLITELFTQLNINNISYAVLRNYEGLPDKPGRDIDIFTNEPENIVKTLSSVSRENGFLLRKVRHFFNVIKYHLIRELPTGFEYVEIDILNAVTWKAIPLAPLNLLHDKILFKGTFFTLTPGAEAAISLIKDLISHRTVLDKYRPKLPIMARSDRAGFMKALGQCFGSTLTSELYELTCRANWKEVEDLAPKLQRRAVLHALSSGPFTQPWRWITFLWRHLLRYFQPSGLFVVLLGPDGSGKSTVALGLQEYLKPLFRSCRYFHGHFRILPRLRDLAIKLGMKLPEENSLDNPIAVRPGVNAPLGLIRSLINLGYYTLDYILGYPVIIKARIRGDLIIFDRYYYDYVIQRVTTVPNWLKSIGLYIIPKPDMVIYLKNQPDIILARKPELSREELERQGAICGQVISSLAHGVTIETTGTPEETIIKVEKSLIKRLIRR